MLTRASTPFRLATLDLRSKEAPREMRGADAYTWDTRSLCACSTRHALNACEQHKSIRTRRTRPRTCGMRAFCLVCSCDRRLPIGFYVNSIQTEPTASGKAAIDWRWDKTHGRPQYHSLRRRCGQLGLCGIHRQNPGQVGWDWIPLTLRPVFACC